jgi:hypothetical protein
MTRFWDRDRRVEVRVDRDITPHYTLSPMLDPHWRAPCPGGCGTEHHYSKTAPRFPTLVEVTHEEEHGGCDSEWCCGQCETYTETVVDYRYCGVCSTVVKPGTTTTWTEVGPWRIEIEKTYDLDGILHRVVAHPTPEQAEEMIASANPRDLAEDVIDRAFVRWCEDPDDFSNPLAVVEITGSIASV